MPPFQNEKYNNFCAEKFIYASHNRGSTLRLHLVPRGVVECILYRLHTRPDRPFDPLTPTSESRPAQCISPYGGGAGSAARWGAHISIPCFHCMIGSSTSHTHSMRGVVTLLGNEKRVPWDCTLVHVRTDPSIGDGSMPVPKLSCASNSREVTG
jgi:hypothetical protein